MKKILFILCLCFSIGVVAQSKEERADRYFKDFKFDNAIALYKDLATDKRKPSLHIIQRLADSYFNTNRYQEATSWYSRLYSIQGEQVGEPNIIKLVQCLKASGNVDKADELLNNFYTDKNRLDMIMAQKSQLDSITKLEHKFTLSNMEFNSKKSDFAPTMYGERLVFASTRDSIKSNGKIYPWNNQPYLDVYVTLPKVNGFVPEKFLGNLESSYHDSNLSFSWDTQTVYFTRNYMNKNKLSANKEGLSNMQILKGTIVRNELVNVSSLNFNSKEYSCGHPAVTKDGRYLYFTSDMAGGYGESDIYVVELTSDGEAFTPPINLGPAINTPGREMFPFIDNDILYFSSDSHYGLGGLDVFASKIHSRSDYALPVNLGRPINSNMDDFSYIWDSGSGNGYLASNRSGGVGDDDIYFFEDAKPVDCLDYSGYVLNERTGEPIADANVELTNPEDGLIAVLKTDANGFYGFTLPCNRKNKLAFSKSTYSKKTNYVTTNDEPQEPSLNNNVYLTPFDSLVEKEGDIEKIKVDPIYFDYDKSNITSRAEIELEKVLFAMREFPQLKIKIESHTDARGADDYNLSLSDDRAKSTRRYLIAKGVDIDRIVSANGYGEYRLKNACKNNVKCSEQEHFVNRRSDFIIVSKGNSEFDEAK